MVLLDETEGYAEEEEEEEGAEAEELVTRQIEQVRRCAKSMKTQHHFDLLTRKPFLIRFAGYLEDLQGKLVRARRV